VNGTRKKTILVVKRVLRVCLLAVLIASCGAANWGTQALFAQDAQKAPASAEKLDGNQPGTGHQQATISGRVVDQSGANIPGVTVKLIREGQPSAPEVSSDGNGEFRFSGVTPGEFQLTISSPGLSTQQFSGTVQAGEAFVTPLIMLTIPTQVTEVHVQPIEEVAQVQINEQEKQRVLGVIPNFYVSYVPDAAPLNTKQKFELAWKSTIDPVTVAGVGLLAGIYQAADRWSAFGQGAQGYGKRFGATYADVGTATFISGAILPSLLKQDPRYYYQGTGSKRSRILHALANSIICKGDNGRWQPNYSTILGSFAAGGLANLYYPANERHGAGLTLSTAFIRIGQISVSGLAQEFIFPKLTPHHKKQNQLQP
jgi:hypothetical protein